MVWQKEDFLRTLIGKKAKLIHMATPTEFNVIKVLDVKKEQEIIRAVLETKSTLPNPFAPYLRSDIWRLEELTEDLPLGFYRK